MSFSKLPVYVEVARPLNTAIAFLSVGCAVIFAAGDIAIWKEALLAALAAGFIAAGANAINDFYDVTIDAVNKPNRPVPRGAISPRDVLIYWAFLSVVGISLNLFLHWLPLVIAAGSVFLLFLYSAVLKKTMLIGNMVVALMTGLAFVYGAVVAGRPEWSFLPATFAVLINFAREIIKDAEDVKGDLVQRARTFPIVFGIGSALALATFALLLLIVVTGVPIVTGVYEVPYAVLVAPVDLAVASVIVSIWKDQSQKNFGRQSFVLKISMIVGLVAILAGTGAFRFF